MKYQYNGVYIEKNEARFLQRTEKNTRMQSLCSFS
jgi:hypothetical protein